MLFLSGLSTPLTTVFHAHLQPELYFVFVFSTPSNIQPPPFCLVCLQTSQGVKDFSVPVGLDAKVKIDLVVVGSVAVSEKGNRQFHRRYGCPRSNNFAVYSYTVDHSAHNSSIYTEALWRFMNVLG